MGEFGQGTRKGQKWGPGGEETEILEEADKSWNEMSISMEGRCTVKKHTETNWGRCGSYRKRWDRLGHGQGEG